MIKQFCSIGLKVLSLRVENGLHCQNAAKMYLKIRKQK